MHIYIYIHISIYTFIDILIGVYVHLFLGFKSGEDFARPQTEILIPTKRRRAGMPAAAAAAE